jgi:hypothetical protein
MNGLLWLGILIRRRRWPAGINSICSSSSRRSHSDAHAVIHATVENPLAEGIPSVTGALARLRQSGLDRHEAIHAIGSVLLEHLQALALAPEPVVDPNSAYFAALDRLTAESWRQSR